MKYFRISILRNRVISDHCLTFFKVCPNNCNNIAFNGNRIRRSLLQNLVRKNYLLNSIVVTNISFFISNNRSKVNRFHMIHEFLNLEEVNESLLEISSNLKRLRFKFLSDNCQKKFFFAVLNCFHTKNYFSENIMFSSELKLVNKEIYLLNKISSQINLKILIKLEIRLKA
uniref:RNA polymerase subunit alpha n=1 Tax=Euglena agilis TaxID=96764 RepID=UPI0023AAC450|nr:RNA polymerase subunit alpha [Euglena agilis]WCH63296.1 RNA polymerase subunit alpha [Euglena agilis]